MVECLHEILHQKVVVIVGDPAALELRCWLVPGVDRYLGSSFADDQGSFAAQEVQLDFPYIGMGCRPDTADGKSSHTAIGHFK